MEKIWVKANSTKKFRGRVAIYEHDTAHVTADNPEGLLCISPCSESDEGYGPYLVAATPYVNECMSQKKLIHVPEPTDAEKEALKFAEDERIGIAKAREEIAAVQERARLEIEVAKARTIVAEVEIATFEAETVEAKAETKKAEARKAKATAKKANTAADKAGTKKTDTGS